MALKDFLSNLPEVKGPLQKRLPFKEKLKWTLIILVAFFILSTIPLWGLGSNALSQFEYLSIILGAKFGSIMSLGIGPIVTASIVLQLLNGSGIIKFDTTSHEGRVAFQGLQKIMTIFFIVFEALIYVYMGGLSPSTALAPEAFRLMQLMLVAQLFVGGIFVMFMDEVISKWGFGSGVSLFIAAGVATEVMVRAFSPLNQAGQIALGSGLPPIGKVWVLFTSLVGGNPINAALAFAAIAATIVVFLFAVYGQAMKIEIPLSFGRIRGQGIRWPLHFLYTSNIPVILVAAFIANIQLFARLFENWGHPIFGTFTGNAPATGIIVWLYPPNIIEGIITGSFQWIQLGHAGVYMLIMILGSIVFSYFWVQTSGMDARSQANQMMASGLQIPGFRRDPRVLESILKRYITPLTIMGGAAIGFLAASADLLGALSRGTGLLLTVMIIYRLYEEIARDHMMDMYPGLRKMMGKE
ncbi:MAG: preprotein translocase subunit SecY [archaeon]